MKNKIERELLNILKDIVKIDTCYPPGSSKMFSNYVKKYLIHIFCLVSSTFYKSYKAEKRHGRL